MARRLPGAPPVLPGYTHVRALGTGGFADVFLYEQAMPRRTIAVKVLLTDVVQGDLRSAFLQETNTLAHLAAHPHVLTMYEAGIAADGRPYLVTEFCPRGYGERFRRERIPVAETLATGLAIGAALETAHRAGVLHRDIKPANVLITAFERPVLADFGIASTLEHLRREESADVGLSVPWAAPELLDGRSPGTVASEVYSFGAMLYALLTGRSPFEKPEGPNDRRALAGRILGHARPAPIGRPDAPPALVQAVETCLRKRPERRPASMMEVLRLLQLAESQLGLRPTPLELAQESMPPVMLSAHAVTALPGTPSGRLDRLGTAPGAESGHTGRRRRTRARAAVAGVDDATRLRGGGFGRARGGGRRRVWIAAAGASVIVAAAAIAVLWQPWEARPGVVASIDARPGPGAVVFTWSAPGEGGDSYEIKVEGRPAIQQEETSYRVDTTTGGARVCLTVAVVHQGSVGRPSAPRCARSGRIEP